MSVPVSAVIIAQNEARYMERCLASVAWADEVLIVDGGSTDGTKEICRAEGRAWSGRARVIENSWPGFGLQRTFAMQNARNDWLLVIDADEECSPELAERIQGFWAEGAGGPPHSAYKLRRAEYFLGRQIHHGIWNPSYQDRFFHRKDVRYVNNIHEYPIFPVKPHIIHEPLIHAPDFSPEKFLSKMNRYTSIEAMDRVRAGQRTNWFRLVTAFPALALKNYFYYGSYKDGMHGVVISLLEGVSRVVRHIKIWQYQREVDRAPGDGR